MTQNARLERELAAWFDETAAPRTPDYVDDLLARVAARRQRRAWTFPERWLPMSALTLARQSLRPIPFRTVGLLALLIILLAATLAFYVGSQRPLPAPFGPAANGLLAFEERGDIVILDPVSGSRRVAITGDALDAAPTFSRDGTRLAFLRGVDGVKSLWVADADGSDQRALSGDAGLGDNSIEWSPDAKAIMVATNSDNGSRISIFPTDGSLAVRTLDVGMPAEGPTWRPPDGKEILFRGTTGTGFGLFAVRPDGTGLRSVVPANGVNEWDGLFFNWSPDGTQIAYQWRDGDGDQLIYVIPAAGGQRRPITSNESVGALWSPDGSKVAFSDGISDPAVVGVASADGSAPVVRTTMPADPVAYAWTPDGTKVLFASGDERELFLFDPVNGQVEPTSWSANGVPNWQRVAP
jgi:TolB protein